MEFVHRMVAPGLGVLSQNGGPRVGSCTTEWWPLGGEFGHIVVYKCGVWQEN